MKQETPKPSYSSQSFVFSAEDLADYTQVREKVSAGGKYVRYGADNKWPLFVVSLLDKSPIHKAIIDRKIQLVLGTSFEMKNLTDTFLQNNPDIEETYKKALIDYVILGYFSLKIYPNKAGDKIARIQHCDATSVRSGVRNEEGKIEKYYISDDWTSKTRPSIKEYPKFNPEQIGKEVSIFVYNSYTPSSKYYSVPSYNAAINDIVVDGEISKFHLANIDNGFNPSVHIRVNKDIEDPIIRDEEAENIYTNYKGSLRAGEAFITFNSPEEKGIEVNPINSNTNDEKFLSLYEKTVQSILSAHSVTSPLLFGIKTTGQLGGSTELLEAQELFTNSFVSPTRTLLTGIFTSLFELAEMSNVEITFEDVPIISNKFSEATLSKILTVNEMRKLAGYEPIDNGNILLT